jgi:hypothetical protein
VTLDFNEYLTRINNGEPSKVLELAEEGQKWLAVREEEALRINPDTAEVWVDYGRCSDPYNLYPEMPDWALFPCDRGACDGQLNELYFVRRPLGNVWVWVGSLSGEVRNALLSGLDLERLEWIQDATMPMRPVRFYRRCSMMRGGNIINDDEPTTSLYHDAPLLEDKRRVSLVSWAALSIDPETADICKAEELEPCGNYYNIYYCRRRGSSVWVAEHELWPVVRSALDERIASREDNILYMSQCDD